MEKFLSMLVLIGFVLAMFPHEVLSQNNVVRWYALDMGFSISSAKSAAGQMFIGTMQQATTCVESGFLADTLLHSPVVAVGEVEGIPTVYALSQNFPNPFNPSTTIRYELPQRSRVEIHLYNIIGQRIATLVNEEHDPGRYTLIWNGQNNLGLQVASGVYFYRLVARDASSSAKSTFVETKKLILLR
ncbi:MAG: T9SS type A sorting domain-containing protein [Ignavibacteriae bacterium]|nr:T9SS type A sorting domain-containing protein [Ignavibacteriota bacterium]